jgi:hypothetical protein
MGPYVDGSGTPRLVAPGTPSRIHTRNLGPDGLLHLQKKKKIHLHFVIYSESSHTGKSLAHITCLVYHHKGY